MARDLLGKILVRGGRKPIAARIVETEAYHGPHDRASHAHRGLTPRTRPMFGAPGHAYVYLIYGMWNCLNLVTMPEGHAAAVLLRAVALPDPRAGAGPGRLCRALGIDRKLDGADVIDGDALWVASDGYRVPAARVARGPRVNVDYAGEPWTARPWRFWIAGERSVSGPVSRR